MAVEEIGWFVVRRPISPSPGDAALSVGRIENNECMYNREENCFHFVSYHKRYSNKRKLLPT